MKKKTHEVCAQCNGWINTRWIAFMVIKMNDGSTKHTHYQRFGGCSQWYQQKHEDKIESVRVFERRGGTYVPKDYAT